MNLEDYDASMHAHSVGVGASLGRAAEIFFGNIAQFALIGAVACLPLAGWFFYALSHEVEFFGVSVALIAVLMVMTSAAADAMVIQATFQAMRHRPAYALTSIGMVAPRFLPVVALSIVCTVVTAIGLVLLVIPGYIAQSVLAVAIPVCVIEKTPLGESMSRSAKLTQGSRWGIFGIAFFMGIANKLVELAIQSLFSGGYGPHYGAAAALSIWYILQMPFGAVVMTVIYHDLRSAKEGVDTDQIAAVFD